MPQSPNLSTSPVKATFRDAGVPNSSLSTTTTPHMNDIFQDINSAKSRNNRIKSNSAVLVPESVPNIQRHVVYHPLDEPNQSAIPEVHSVLIEKIPERTKQVGTPKPNEPVIKDEMEKRPSTSSHRNSLHGSRNSISGDSLIGRGRETSKKKDPVQSTSNTGAKIAPDSRPIIIQTKSSSIPTVTTTASVMKTSVSKRDGAENINEARGNQDEEPDEIRYCYCNQVSYGKMVACDGVNCQKEWFHLPCVNLSHMPGPKGMMYLHCSMPSIESN